jgi:hypothetical protein
MLTVQSYISVRICFISHIYISDEKCPICLLRFFSLSVTTTKVILRFVLKSSDVELVGYV